MIPSWLIRSTAVGFLLLLCLVSTGITETIVPGEAIVKFKVGGTPKSILNHPGITIADSIPDEQTYLLEFDTTRQVGGIIKMLLKNPHIQFAQPNHHYVLPEVQQISIGFPDQERPVFSFGTNPPTYYDQTGVYATGLDSAQVLASGAGVTVAVIDNGISFDHPLMQSSRVLGGHDFIDNDNDPSEEPGTMYGHGTFVTGLILLAAPDCQIVPIRAFDGDGVGSEFNTAKSIRKAIELGAQVINMSFGTFEQYPVLASVVDRALSAGVVLVAASGNYGTTVPLYPAAFGSVISVGAVDTQDQRALFSSYGPTLDLVAPGVNVYSSLAGEYEWGTWSGTSFSAPFVTGTVALVLERTGPLSSAAIQNHLRLTARSTLLWGELDVPDSYFGWGALDAYAAVADAAKGDLDNSGVVDATDLRILSRLVFAGGQGHHGRPVSVRQCDLNCNNGLDAGDVDRLAAYLFRGGPAPHRCTE